MKKEIKSENLYEKKKEIMPLLQNIYMILRKCSIISILRNVKLQKCIFNVLMKSKRTTKINVSLLFSI